MKDTRPKPEPEWLDPPPLASTDEHDPHDVYGPPLPEGEYVVGFIRQERRNEMFKNRATKWLVTFQVEEGPHAGRWLLYAVPALPERRRPRPGFKFCSLFCAVAPGRRPPKDLWRRSPRNLLEGTRVLVSVVTVRKNASGELQPEGLWYSKVDKVMSLIAGTPPAFRETKS